MKPKIPYFKVFSSLCFFQFLDGNDESGAYIKEADGYIQKVSRDDLPNYGFQIVDGKVVKLLTASQDETTEQPEVRPVTVSSDNQEPTIPRESTIKKVHSFLILSNATNFV